MTDKKTLLSEERSGRSLAIARADMKKSKGKKEESNTIACLPACTRERAHKTKPKHTTTPLRQAATLRDKNGLSQCYGMVGFQRRNHRVPRGHNGMSRRNSKLGVG
jgi:hypothetical protein